MSTESRITSLEERITALETKITELTELTTTSHEEYCNAIDVLTNYKKDIFMLTKPIYSQPYLANRVLDSMSTVSQYIQKLARKADNEQFGELITAVCIDMPILKNIIHTKETITYADTNEIRDNISNLITIMTKHISSEY